MRRGGAQDAVCTEAADKVARKMVEVWLRIPLPNLHAK